MPSPIAILGARDKFLRTARLKVLQSASERWTLDRNLAMRTRASVMRNFIWGGARKRRLILTTLSAFLLVILSCLGRWTVFVGFAKLWQLADAEADGSWFRRSIEANRNHSDGISDLAAALGARR